ncbi:MAG: efflux RND transporter permease subunit [Gammaproteobacteria bacterium]
MSEPPSNSAGRLAGLFIDSRLTLLFVLGLALFGVLALLLTPREENPQIVVPGAVVSIDLPGASVEEVEALLVIPLEGILSEMSDVKHTYAVSAYGRGSVQVEFDVGVPQETALVRVYDKVQQNTHRLPPGAGQPGVLPVVVDDIPVVAVTLSSANYDDYALKRIADRMAIRLRSLPDVSVVSVVGGRDREVRVEFDPERMQAFGISINQGMALLAASNLAESVGVAVDNGRSSSVYVDGQLRSIEAVRRLVVGSHEDRPIYLEDVADVVDGPQQERRHLTRFSLGQAHPDYDQGNYREVAAVTLAIAKKRGTNAVRVADQVLDRIERMKPLIAPRDVRFDVTRNDGTKADKAVNRLVIQLGISLLSVSFVLALFLGLREAAIVTLLVPLAFFATLIVDYFIGISINRVTLFGLILSIGMLVDAGIVVVENIHRHINDSPDDDPNQVAIEATREVGNPTNLATLAIMAVFSSMIVVTGMAGEYFYPITVDVPVAIFASLIVAYIVGPWAAVRLIKPTLQSHTAARRDAWVFSRYRYRLGRLLDSSKQRRNFFSVLTLLLVLTLLMPAWQFLRPQGVAGPLSAGGVAMTFLPKDDQNTFNITIDMPEDSVIEETDRLARKIGQALDREPLVESYLTTLSIPGVVDLPGLLRGNLDRYGEYLGEVRVNLLPKERRLASSIGLVAQLREKITAVQQAFPGSVIHLVENPPGPPSRAMVLAEIYANDPKIHKRMAAHVKQQVEDTWGMVEVFDSDPVATSRVRVIVDQEKAALSGVSTRQVQQTLKILFEGQIVGNIHADGELNVVPLRVLVRVYLSNREGKRVPLTEVTRVVTEAETAPIQRKDNERVIYVGGEQLAATSFNAVLDLDARLRKQFAHQGIDLPTSNLSLWESAPDTVNGPQLLWSGEVRMMLDAYREMGLAVVLAVTFVYLILVGYYQSFTVPLIAMAAIPLGVIGVFPGHWIMGVPFSGASIIGIIALSGVVVRSSLLIIDFAGEKIAAGVELREAVIDAATLRLRPIFLTAVTVLLGSLVMLLDPVFNGLAVSLIFGTLVSTVLTVLVIPVIIYRVARGQAAKGIRFLG